MVPGGGDDHLESGSPGTFYLHLVIPGTRSLATLAELGAMIKSYRFQSQLMSLSWYGYWCDRSWLQVAG